MPGSTPDARPPHLARPWTGDSLPHTPDPPGRDRARRCGDSRPAADRDVRHRTAGSRPRAVRRVRPGGRGRLGVRRRRGGRVAAARPPRAAALVPAAAGGRGRRRRRRAGRPGGGVARGRRAGASSAPWPCWSGSRCRRPASSSGPGGPAWCRPVELDAALFLESAFDEAMFVVGPLLVTALGAALGPGTALLLAAAVTTAGLLGLAATSPHADVPPHEGGAPSPLPRRTLALLYAGFLALGTGFAAIQVGVLAGSPDAPATGRRAADVVLRAQPGRRAHRGTARPGRAVAHRPRGARCRAPHPTAGRSQPHAHAGAAARAGRPGRVTFGRAGVRPGCGTDPRGPAGAGVRVVRRRPERRPGPRQRPGRPRRGSGRTVRAVRCRRGRRADRRGRGAAGRRCPRLLP